MILNFKVSPKEGVGPIKFGMNISAVRALFSETPRSFNRTTFSSHPTDFFEQLGIFVNYDADGKVEAVEFDDKLNVVFNTKSISGLTARSAKSLIQEFGSTFTESFDSIVAECLGVSFWVPDIKNEGEDAMVRSVVVFCDGYYDVPN